MESRGDGGPFQVTPEQGRALAAHLREQNVRLSESLSKRIFDTDFLKSMQRFATEATAEVVRNLQPIAVSMVEHFRASLPDNWKGFESARQIGEIFDVMESTGWCLAWVPREEIVRAILAEDADGRSRALLAHWNEVVADIQELTSKSCWKGFKRPSSLNSGPPPSRRRQLTEVGIRRRLKLLQLRR